MKQLFEYVKNQEVIHVNPYDDIKYLNEKGHERNKYVLPKMLNKLVKASKEIKAKFYIPSLIYFGAEHDTSKQEAHGLTWHDIDFDYKGIGLIRFFRTKNGKSANRILNAKNQKGSASMEITHWVHAS